MDKFREEQNRRVDVGGIHCPCCNKYTGKDKPLLNRQVRRVLRQELTTTGIEITKEDHNNGIHNG